MASNRMRTEEARRRAQEKIAKAEEREKNLLKEKNKAIAAMASKTARLRSLRLAKEASDKDAADKELADKELAEKVVANKKSTDPDIDEELLNRCLVLSVDEGGSQTGEVHKQQRHGQTINCLNNKQKRDALGLYLGIFCAQSPIFYLQLDQHHLALLILLGNSHRNSIGALLFVETGYV